ncbi:MAG: hypothetical protein RSD95_15475 [Clostridia bacterium]
MRAVFAGEFAEKRVHAKSEGKTAIGLVLHAIVNGNAALAERVREGKAMRKRKAREAIVPPFKDVKRAHPNAVVENFGFIEAPRLVIEQAVHEPTAPALGLRIRNAFEGEAAVPNAVGRRIQDRIPQKAGRGDMGFVVLQNIHPVDDETKEIAAELRGNARDSIFSIVDRSAPERHNRPIQRALVNCIAVLHARIRPF